MHSGEHRAARKVTSRSHCVSRSDITVADTASRPSMESDSIVSVAHIACPLPALNRPPTRPSATMAGVAAISGLTVHPLPHSKTATRNGRPATTDATASTETYPDKTLRKTEEKEREGEGRGRGT